MVARVLSVSRCWVRRRHVARPPALWTQRSGPMRRGHTPLARRAPSKCSTSARKFRSHAWGTIKTTVERVERGLGPFVPLASAARRPGVLACRDKTPSDRSNLPHKNNSYYWKKRLDYTFRRVYPG